MKTFATAGRSAIGAPILSDGEIERICSDALREVDLYPKEPGPVRIERFITKRFGVTPIYEALPAGVLGFTCFGEKGVDAVSSPPRSSKKEQRRPTAG